MADSLSYTPHEPMDWGSEPLHPEDVDYELESKTELLASRSGELAESFSVEDSILTNVAQSEKINRLISMAMAGALPRARALKEWEPDKLNARHISVIMLRAVGYQQNRIAELSGYSVPAVSVILNHPDSKTLLAAILSEGAKQAIDISGQVKREAPKMLAIAKEIANDVEVKPETRIRAAFGWIGLYERTLDREKGSGDTEKVSMHREDAGRLIAALHEAQAIRGGTRIELQGQDSSGNHVPSVVSASEPSYLPEGAIDPVLMEKAQRQYALEQALEAQISALEPSQGQADGSELLAPATSIGAGVARSNPRGLSISHRTEPNVESSAEPTISTPTAAVDVRTERQVSTQNVEEVA
jgi:hypothetical protein